MLIEQAKEILNKTENPNRFYSRLPSIEEEEDNNPNYYLREKVKYMI